MKKWEEFMTVNGITIINIKEIADLAQFFSEHKNYMFSSSIHMNIPTLVNTAKAKGKTTVVLV